MCYRVGFCLVDRDLIYCMPGFEMTLFSFFPQYCPKVFNTSDVSILMHHTLPS